MKRSMKINFILSILMCLVVSNSSYAREYTDVKPSTWAYADITKLTSEKYMDCFSDEKFFPSKPVTRVEFSEMMIKALDQEDMHIETMYTFDDISNKHPKWKYVIKAVNLDILRPASDGNFYPDDYVTRAEMITFLSNILKTEDITKKEAIIALQNYYLDFDDIPDWLKVDAGKAEILDVIAKEPPRQQYLDHDKYVTRAQMAVFLSKLLQQAQTYYEEDNKVATAPRIAEGLVVENLVQEGDMVTIPSKTSLPIMVLGRINSDKSQAGDMFHAKFVNNIVDKDNHLLLPKDILLIGKILHTTKSKKFVRNGELVIELSALDNSNLLTRITAYSECETIKYEGNKIKKFGKNIIKGEEFDAMEGQTLYVKLINPIRVNIITGEIFDK